MKTIFISMADSIVKPTAQYSLNFIFNFTLVVKQKNIHKVEQWFPLQGKLAHVSLLPSQPSFPA